MKRLLTALFLACMSTSSFAETVVVPSTRTVSDTVKRLKSSVEDAGARVFCVIDFGSGVKTIGKDIGDLKLVVFGDPRIGAPALSADPMAALDLPGKVLVYNSGAGTVMAYEVPADMLAERKIPPDAPVLQVMSDTLRKITSAAAK